MSAAVATAPSSGKVTDLLALREQETGKPVEPAGNEITKRTLERMKRSNESRKKRGQFGGLTLAPLGNVSGSDWVRFYQMNHAWGGIDHGCHLIGGDTNMGKSSVARMIAYDIMRFNKNVHVRFYTLDDAEDYFFDCFVAQAAKVPINAVNKPEGFINKPEEYYKKRDYERMVERGHEMYQRFLSGEFAEKFSYVGTASMQTTDWTVIEDDIKRTRQMLPRDVELVVFIDNFHDIEMPGYENDNNRKTEEVANRCGQLCEKLQITMIGTVELKKNNQRRPTLDDIFGSRKWKYKARTVILVYSEVGAQKPNPRLYYERPDKPNEQSSVLEVHFVKSKGNEFKGRLFYEQLTEMGLMLEVPKDRAAQYALSIS